MTLGDEETTCLRNVGHRVFKDLVSADRTDAKIVLWISVLYPVLRRCAAAMWTLQRAMLLLN
jgi:hypothetical protein